MGGPLGGLIDFPRKGARRGDAEWNDRENAPLTARADRDASPILWIDMARRRDADDDGDGGGGGAAA